jgi:competence protein ComEC
VVTDRLAALVWSQRAHLPLWSPVLLACGIGAYFSVPEEPSRQVLAGVALAGLLGIVLALRAGPLLRLALVAVLLMLGGFGSAAFRSAQVAAPVLPWSMTANVEGRIIGIDRSGSGRPRLLLDRVVIHGVEPERTPARIRLSLGSDGDSAILVAGLRVLGQARLSPPSAPSEPGAFDFRRMAWFMQIGAVGYTRSPMVEAYPRAEDVTGFAVHILAVRRALSAAIHAHMPGAHAGFAAAILTGDRSEVDPAALDDLRASNLAHLLAISGLHMGLLSGFVFALVRGGLALVPAIALNYPIKKVAAMVALSAGAAYLVISGASIATQRAFIMTAVVLVAVVLDRPAFTLRSVALAALLVLSVRPESLTEAGFQMSFAATTALIATFEWLRAKPWWRETWRPGWRFLRPVIGVTITSFVAGLATAPISAFHFNVLSRYGLIANVLAVPAMGLVVMPAAVLAGLLAPLGLSWPGLLAMDLGIGYILWVAHAVASLDGAVRAIPVGPVWALVLIVLGGLLLVLWIGRFRIAGLLPMVLGLGLWMQVDRPEILISENGRLFGVLTAQGRVLNSEGGNGFAAEIWLGNDGDPAGQAAAFARAGMTRSRGRAEIDVAGLGPLIYRGSREPGDEASSLCAASAILLAPGWRRDPPEGDCLFIGADLLRSEGALAIRLSERGLDVRGARSLNERRPWTRDPRDLWQAARGQ